MEAFLMGEMEAFLSVGSPVTSGELKSTKFRAYDYDKHFQSAKYVVKL